MGNVQQGPSPVYQNAGYMDASCTALNPCLLYKYCDPAQGSALDADFGGFTMSTQLPKTPKYKFPTSPSYQAALSNGSKLLFMADYTSTAKMQNTAPKRR